MALAGTAGGPQKGPTITMSTMKSKRRPEPGAEPEGQQPPQEVIDRLAGLLPEGALEDAVKGLRPEELSGPGGLLSQLAGRVVEAALEAELTEHLGHPPGGVPQGSNVRNGVDAPRRCRPIWGRCRSRRRATATASFEPQLVAKRQTRLAGLDDKILGLYAGGMTVRDISATCPSSTAPRSAATRSAGSPTPCSRTSQAWRTRPLERSIRSSTSTRWS